MPPKKEPKFGFNCGIFNVELLGTDLIVPRAKTSRLVRSMNRMVAFHNNAGAFTFEALHGGKVICRVPVIAGWRKDDAGGEDFLALRSVDAVAIVTSLGAYRGKSVVLTFTEI